MSQRKGALVTGGAVRLGASIAERLARMGYDVAIHCNTSEEAAWSLAGRLAEQYDVRTCIVRRDLSGDDVGTIVAEAVNKLDTTLNVLINSASVYEGDHLAQFSAKTFDQHMAVNVRAPLVLMQAFVDQAGDNASIVNILDQRVLRPTPKYFSYSLSKDALHGATIMAAQALSSMGIRVNGVAPGLTLVNDRQDPVEYEKRIARLPLARGGSPEEVADAVAFLVGSAPSVTGQVIAIDGGQHLVWDSSSSQPQH